MLSAFYCFGSNPLAAMDAGLGVPAGQFGADLDRMRAASMSMLTHP